MCWYWHKPTFIVSEWGALLWQATFTVPTKIDTRSAYALKNLANWFFLHSSIITFLYLQLQVTTEVICEGIQRMESSEVKPTSIF